MFNIDRPTATSSSDLIIYIIDIHITFISIHRRLKKINIAPTLCFMLMDEAAILGATTECRKNIFIYTIVIIFVDSVQTIVNTF